MNCFHVEIPIVHGNLFFLRGWEWDIFDTVPLVIEQVIKNFIRFHRFRL